MKSARIKAKDKAWKECSIFVRTRDAYATCSGKTVWSETKDGGTDVLVSKCCTCDKEYPAFGKGCGQAGHFEPGRKGAVLLDERGIHFQCYNCNVNLKGNPREYQTFMVNKYGQELVDELDMMAGVDVQYKEHDFLRIAEQFKKMTEELCQKEDIKAN